MWVAFRLGVVGNWSWKGVMPMKCLGVRPDTSKPPTRRITRTSYESIPTFQYVTFKIPSRTSFSTFIPNYFILNPFFEQLFCEAKAPELMP